MKTKKNILICLTIIFLVIFSYSLYKIIIWKVDNSKNKKIQEDTLKFVEKKDTGEELENIEEENVEKKEEYTVNFEELKKRNADAVLYLKVNETNINYVVVKTNNNSYYLKHNFDKEYNISGWPFVDYLNKLDGTDKNIIIYGHNTLDGTMFGTLKETLKEDWYKNEDNYIVQVVFDDKLEKYKVFSIYEIKVEDYYIKKNFENDTVYEEFLNKLKNRSVYDFGVTLNKDDKILTLSTCSDSGKKRVVLHAVKI